MQVVAHYLDGRVIRGASLDVDAGRLVFHIAADFGPLVKVELEKLKALYVVRTLDGDRSEHDRRRVDPGDARRRGGHGVEVTFWDGERLVGLTLHDAGGGHLLLLPADPESNNLRILVNRAAIA
ncbi:MAG TPA: hypothetical protein VFT84_01015, partial [Gemmatimonadales bacterium]|nr:hypothetical protein [Gemmatimonadales bacterium]